MEGTKHRQPGGTEHDGERQAFLFPSEEFTPFPFWFWNDELNEEELDRQILAFWEKGVNGFIIHPRKGLPESIGYLTERYFHFVRHAAERAAQLGMRVILYDEGMYPSGSCHGQVVRENPAWASRGLQMCAEGEKPGDNAVLTASWQDPETGKTFAFYECDSHGTIRGLHEGEDDGEPGAPASADLLNPEAVACFIRLTHEVYYQHLKDWFGSTVIGFFTDEPCVLGRCPKEGLIPWSGGMLEEFLDAGGRTQDLRRLFGSGQEPEDKKARACYERALYGRMSRSYYGQISAWCRAHGTALLGHPEKSTDIGYLQHFTVPCQDVVWRYVAPGEESALRGGHSTMAKCSSDSARHRGKRRNGNECFGCCGSPEDPFLFTAEDMKWYLDWLFVRGVNLIIPHAFYYSLRDGRGEERPPEVGMHSSFWDEYRTFTNYIKRLSRLNTDSVNQARTAVLCTAQELSWEMVLSLYENQIEFNYLEEELLPIARMEEGCLRIRDQRYQVLVTDEGVSEETKQWLEDFEARGGTLIRWKRGECTADSLRGLMEEGRLERDVTAQTSCPTLRFTHVRRKEQPEGGFYLFTNEGEEEIRTRLTFDSGRAVRLWDAWRGSVRDVVRPERTMELRLGRRESLIVETCP